MLIQHFFLEGQLLASTTRRYFVRQNLAQAPRSELFFCGVCGEVYAKCPVMGASGVEGWDSVRGLCRKCRHPAWMESMSNVPGSVLLTWDKEYLAALPMPVLKWELDRHIEHWERIHNE